MKGARRLLLLIAVLTGGCNLLDPYATSPLAAKPGVTDAGSRVAICYNTLTTDQAKVQQMAQTECAANTVAEQVDYDYRIDHCPLLLPGRATFVCKPKK